MKCRSCHYDYDHDHDHDDPDNHDQLSPSPVENCGAIGEGGGRAVAGITWRQQSVICVFVKVLFTFDLMGGIIV